jgi:hypothetical protein
VNLCENWPDILDSVKFEAEKVITPNSQEYLKGKATAFSMNQTLFTFINFEKYICVKFQIISALCEI